jgi:surfeit locus 1 family protein
VGDRRPAAERRRAFRPGFWPTLFAAVGVIALAALGTWQVQRLHWKEALIAARARAEAAPVLDLRDPTDVRPEDDFRSMRLVGRFRHDREFHLLGRVQGGEAGAHVVTPLILDDGAMVLVDRGFVPLDRLAPATRPEGQMEGRVAVRGTVRWPEPPGWFTPSSDPAANAWYRLDPEAMAVAAGLRRVAPFYVAADATPNPGGLPRGGATFSPFPNNHLGYALTWYGLALSLAVIYILFGFRRGAETGRPASP